MKDMRFPVKAPKCIKVASSLQQAYLIEVEVLLDLRLWRQKNNHI